MESGPREQARKSGPREQARKDLRDYDNPKGGLNKNYANPLYLLSLLNKWNFVTEEGLRAWANSARKGSKKYD